MFKDSSTTSVQLIAHPNFIVHVYEIWKVHTALKLDPLTMMLVFVVFMLMMLVLVVLMLMALVVVIMVGA